MGLAKELPDIPNVRWGRDRGSAVHRAIDLYERGLLDPATLHEDVAGHFAGYRAFRCETGYVPLAVEEPVSHAVLRYRGTLDSRGPFGDAMAILDFKCGDRPDLAAAAYQLAAYAVAWAQNEDRDTPIDEPIPRRYVIQLGAESYRVHDVTTEQAVTIWKAAVTLYWAQRDTGAWR
jgi:hypothetical protein